MHEPCSADGLWLGASTLMHTAGRDSLSTYNLPSSSFQVAGSTLSLQTMTVFPRLTVLRHHRLPDRPGGFLALCSLTFGGRLSPADLTPLTWGPELLILTVLRHHRSPSRSEALPPRAGARPPKMKAWLPTAAPQWKKRGEGSAAPVVSGCSQAPLVACAPGIKNEDAGLRSRWQVCGDPVRTLVAP